MLSTQALFCVDLHRTRSKNLKLLPAVVRLMESCKYLLLSLLIGLVATLSGEATASPRIPAPLNILVIPHSHDDVGWEKTIDDYYESEVKYIYETVTQALAANPSRKFNVVEIAFFQKWWQTDASDEDKGLWLKFVQNGQIEFLTAGWVMQDDAVSSYSANIDQLTIGHQFVYELFGVRPRIGWMIDPFGLSSQTATHYAMMGFNAHVFARIPYDIKYHMQQTQTLEFVWRGSSSNFQDKYDLFSHALDQSAYTTRGGFHWDQGDSPVTSGNIDSLANLLLADVSWRMTCFRTNETNNFAWLWGGDFEFQNATMMFDNMDKIVNYINEKYAAEATIRYATMSEYIQIVNNLQLTWGVYEDDFFPLATNSTFWKAHTKWGDQGLGYWTGFYTSRPGLKGLVRVSDSLLRTAETQYAFNLAAYHNSNKDLQYLDRLRKAVAECAHHDGVTGTSSADVVQMYVDDLQNARDQIQPSLVSSLQNILSRSNFGAPPAPISTSANNMQALLASLHDPSQTVPIILYNNLGWKHCRYVNVPVPRKDIHVLDSTGNPVIEYQINPSSNTSGDQSMPYTLFFYACIPPMGYQTYFIGIAKTREKEATPKTVKTTIRFGEDNKDRKAYTINNGVYQLTFSPTTGLLSTLQYTTRNPSNTSIHTIDFNQELAEYDSYTYYNKKVGSASGTYIFHPTGPAVGIRNGEVAIYQTIGKYVSEIVQVFDGTHKQTIRLYNSPSGDDEEDFVNHIVEMVHDIGPIDENKEVITRFNTSVQSGNLFYTDGNGLEVRERKYDPTKPLNIPANYYPSVMTSFIRDSNVQFTVLTDRAHGVSSQAEGELELMLHRRLVQSDGLGPMDDDMSQITNITNWIVVNNPVENTRVRHNLNQMLQYPLMQYYGTSLTNIAKWNSIYSSVFSPLQQSLPLNIHLLTFKPQFSSLSSFDNNNNNDNNSYNNSMVLLRLLHMYERNEDPLYSKTVTIDLADIFSSSSSENITIVSIEERSLTTVWSPSEMNRLHWNTNSQGEEEVVGEKTSIRILDSTQPTSLPTSTSVVTLDPMEIKTYFVQFK